MGIGQSIPKGIPSQQTYSQKTIPSQTLVNNIFLWMLNETNIQDLLRLANPKYCKEYVFFTKEALDTYFDQMKLYPKLGKERTLYFESVKQLTFSDEKTEKEKPQQKAYRDELCAELAFFYIRIFQVFGALALTVIDTFPEAKATEADIRAAALYPQIRRPPLFGQRAVYTGGAKVTQRDDKLSLGTFFDVAKDYFFTIGRPDIYLIGEVDSKKQFNPLKDTNTLFFYSSTKEITLRSSNSIVEANLSIENPNLGVSYNLVINNIRLKDEPLSISYTIPFTFVRSDYLFMKQNFYNVLYTTLSSILKEGDRARSLEELFEAKEAPVAARKNEAAAAAGLEEPYSYGPIIRYLKEKPKAYCVARAIQLLSPTLLEGVQKGVPSVSSICFTTNPEFKDSTPNYGQPITPGSAGIRILNQLFYDFLRGSVPKISEETKPKYDEFVRVMQTVFSPEFPSKPAATLEKVISGPLRPCEDPALKDKQILIQNQNAVREIRKYVALLLNEQMSHTANVMKFLQKMFVLSKEGRIIGLQPSLLKGGIPAVNAMAEDARNLLTEYYKKCEGTYRLGALEVLAAPNKIIREKAK